MSRTDGGLRNIFRQRLPKVHWQSIEVPAIAKGVPDMNGCYKGKEFWVENKVTKGWTIGLRPHQAAWLMRRSRAGGRTRIAVRRRNTTVDELWILDGKYADKIIRANNLHQLLDKYTGYTDKVVLCVSANTPAHWTWDEILAALLRA
jgi:hypothetical protein